MPQQLDLCEGHITIVSLDGGGSISSDLHETCPHCGDPDCNLMCDESQDADPPETDDEINARLRWNCYCDGLESLILALACAGYDVTDSKFQEAVKTAINAGANNL